MPDDPLRAAADRRLDAQAEKGRRKYGKTLAVAALPLVELLEHRCEESADGLMYDEDALIKARELVAEREHYRATLEEARMWLGAWHDHVGIPDDVLPRVLAVMDRCDAALAGASADGPCEGEYQAQ